MADKHILRIHDTQANLLNDLKDTQIAWATDTEEAIWRDGNNFHFIGSGKYWDGSQFVFDNIDVGEVSFFDKTAGSILGKLTADGGNFNINFNGVDISIDASSLDLTSVTSVTANDPTLAQEVATKNYVDANAVNIPTPALNGSFLVKNTNGTFTMLDGVSIPQFRWDAINSKFVWDGTLDFTGAHNYKSGSSIKFLNASGVAQGRILDSNSANYLSISSDTTGLANRDLRLEASGDIILQASNGEVDINTDANVTGDLVVNGSLTLDLNQILLNRLGNPHGRITSISSSYMDLTATGTGVDLRLESQDGDVNIIASGTTNINGADIGQLQVTGDTTLTNLPTGTQVGLVGYDSAGKLIQGASSGGTQDLDSVLTQGNSSSQNINLISGASLNVDGQVDVGGILDVGENASSPQMRLGKNTFLTSVGAGISQLISGGSIFYDFKTSASGSIFFRCGEGAEAGSAHQFMVVDPTDGSVKIPNLPTGTQVGLVGYDSTGKLIEADRQLTTQALTNPSTMAVDASLYKQISANNLAQTCTIPLPTNGGDDSSVIYRFRASATSTLSWNAGFNDLKGALPTSIAINKSLYVGVKYDAFTSTWDVVSVVEQN